MAMVTLYQDSAGELLPGQVYIVERISMSGKHLGKLHCTDPARPGSCIMVALSGKPNIRPLAERETQPSKAVDMTEFDSWKRKNDALLAWWRRK